MAKLFYMQFYPSDYQADVRCLPMATQGAWMQILCVLWRSPQRGKRTLNLDEWARELGCTSSDLSLYLMQLEHHKVGKISRELIENVEQITISSKRIMREKMKQSLALKRKQKQRVASMSRGCHTNVTALSHQCHAEELELELKSELIKKEEEEKKGMQGEVTRSVQKRSRAVLCDVEWVQSLKENPAYIGIDIDLQYRKASVWYPEHNRQLTRRAFTNWLIKEMGNKPIAISGTVSTCQERVQRGAFLKPCGAPVVGMIGGRPLCKQHKEYHDARDSRATT